MTTTHWASSENSRRRNSFNAIINRKEFDAPEDQMKHGNMGRQAVLGPEWVPNGIIARVRAGTLVPTRAASFSQLPGKTPVKPMPEMTGSFATLSLRHAIHRDMAESRRDSFEGDIGGSATGGSPPQSPSHLGGSALLRPRSTPDLRIDVPQTPQGRGIALMPLKPQSPGQRSSSLTTVGDNPSPRSQGSGPISPVMSPSHGRLSPNSSTMSWRPNGSTTKWRPTEISQKRECFNKIVAREKFDPPSNLILHGTMGRKAEHDDNFEPNAIFARRMSGCLPHPERLTSPSLA